MGSLGEGKWEASKMISSEVLYFSPVFNEFLSLTIIPGFQRQRIVLQIV